MDLSIRIRIEALPEGVFLATSEDLQGLVAQGHTISETLAHAREVARALIESRIEHGESTPPAPAPSAQ